MNLTTVVIGVAALAVTLLIAVFAAYRWGKADEARKAAETRGESNATVAAVFANDRPGDVTKRLQDGEF